MDKIKVRAHTCYLGKTGYNAHARGFFRELSKYVDLRVRNYTWDDNPNYLNEVDLGILDLISLSTGDQKYEDFKIKDRFPSFKFTTPETPFQQDVDIVLMDMNHHYFYEKHPGKIKIAYTVWESTRLPEYFVDRLIENFDYVWVVTEWHKKVLNEQGYPESRIHVVNEAVDADFFPTKFDSNFADYQDGRFKFSIFGRWDFRKSVPEIINAFLQEFKKDEPVDLILSVDNPYAVDGMNSTEERLRKYDFIDPRLKVKHFVNRKDYIKYIQNGHILITCARSEGWNLPLIEAIAAGTPTIYSDYGAQLEFAEQTGVPVSIKGLVPCLSGDTYNVQALSGTEVPGYYAQPDYEDLQKKMRFAYENYSSLKEKALKDSERIRNTFTWKNAAEQAMSFIHEKLKPSYAEKRSDECVIILSHVDTKIKKLKLDDLVSKFEKEGYYTIVSSHIPVETNADYVLVDKYNPVITAETAKDLGINLPYFFFRTPVLISHTQFKYNHGPAALNLIKNGLSVARGRNFEIAHIVNYDYHIKDTKVFDEHATELKEVDLVSYRWLTNDEVGTGFFSAKVNQLEDVLRDVSSVKEYIKYGNHLENVMYNILQRKNVKYKKLNSIDTNKVIVNTETAPTYPTMSVGKNVFYFSFSIDEQSNGKILSFLSQQEFPIEVRLIKGNKFYQEYLENEDIHFWISDDVIKGGFTIYLPSFEKSFFVDENFVLGVCTVHDRSKIRQLNLDSFVSLSSKTRKINVNFIEGPWIEITDSVKGNYRIEFIDDSANEIVYSHEINENCWVRASRKWYTDWRIVVKDLLNDEVIYDKKIDLKGQRVFICMESSSLGDNLGWMPYAEEFRKKHDCHVIVSTFYNYLFKDQYPDLEFIERGESANNIHASYRVGWFYDGDKDKIDEFKCPVDFKDQPMQKSAADILGLEYRQIRPKITIQNSAPKIQGKYVCIGIHSTAQAKYWNNPEGWQKLVDYLNSQGYKVVLISKEIGDYMGNKQPVGIIDKTGNFSLQDRINDLKHAEFYIGLGSGLTWLAWAVGTPIVLISGFSSPETEFLGDDIVRIFNPDKCNSCFNRHRLDAGDWNWCPDHKGTPRQFECTKSITAEFVIEKIKKFVK